MAGVAPSSGPFEGTAPKTNPGLQSRDEKGLDDDSSPAASLAVDEETKAVKTSHSLGSTEDHVFADPSAADYWRKVYEQAGYENRHRFDPSFQWTAEEEKKLIRKVSLGHEESSSRTRPLMSWVYRSTGASCSGHGSCSFPWISIARTSSQYLADCPCREKTKTNIQYSRAISDNMVRVGYLSWRLMHSDAA